MDRAIFVEQGMTLRDYFAANAPEMPKWFYETSFCSSIDEKLSRLAQWRWAYADAMIAGRGE
jgi:hypothetical protein